VRWLREGGCGEHGQQEARHIKLRISRNFFVFRRPPRATVRAPVDQCKYRPIDRHGKSRIPSPWTQHSETQKQTEPMKLLIIRIIRPYDFSDGSDHGREVGPDNISVVKIIKPCMAVSIGAARPIAVALRCGGDACRALTTIRSKNLTVRLRSARRDATISFIFAARTAPCEGRPWYPQCAERAADWGDVPAACRIIFYIGRPEGCS
jgi:hypothetical protein